MKTKTVAILGVVTCIGAFGLALGLGIFGTPVVDPQIIPLIDPHIIPLIDPHIIPLIDPHIIPLIDPH